MKLSDQNLIELSQLAQTVAIRAGEIIKTYSQKSFDIFHKKSGNTLASQVVTEVDHACEAEILKGLQASADKFDLAILSEEQEDDKRRLQKDYFWCTDPMDGTLAFTESQAGYAVSIALVSKDGTPVIGVVYDPVKDIIYTATKGFGAYRNNSLWKLDHSKSKGILTMPCDCSLLARSDYKAIRKTLLEWSINEGYDGLEEIHHGGAVMNAIWTIENTPACYFKLPKVQEGGGSLWDFAATACIFNELGIPVCDFTGKSLDLNRSDSTFMNHRGAIFCSDIKLIKFIQSLASHSA